MGDERAAIAGASAPGTGAPVLAKRGSVVVLLAVVVVFAHSGALGLDYGNHWDEWYHLSGVRKSIDELSLLTGEYTYNGLYFLPGQALVGVRALPALPGVLEEIKASPMRTFDAAAYPALISLQQDLIRYTKTRKFVLRVRAVFLALSSLSIVWVWIAARRLWPERPLMAACAAAHFGLSWHVAFHSRFIAVDAMQAMWAALLLVGVAIAAGASTFSAARFGVVIAGIAAGASLGCKATGVFASASVVGAALCVPAIASPRSKDRAALTAIGLVVFGITFVATTPGVWIEPLRVIGSVYFESRNYQTMAHGTAASYGVTGPFDLYARIATWALLSAPSHFLPIAALLSALTLTGGVREVVRERRTTIALAASTIALLLFLATTRQLIVRNLLSVLPLLSLFFGAGVGFLFDAIAAGRQRPALRVVVTAALSTLFVANGAWLYVAAFSTRITTEESIEDDAVEWLEASDEPVFRMSARAAETLAAPAGYTCESSKATEALPAVVYSAEVAMGGWKANRPNGFLAVFGPAAVDYDWYPSWGGRHANHRIVVLDGDIARQMDFRTRYEHWPICRR